MINKIGIITNLEKRKSKKASEEIVRFLKRYGIEVLGLENINKSQLVIALGGDGMLLRSAQIVDSKIPVLPVNCGRLGFLFQMDVLQFKEKFRQIVKGNFKIENRMMLSATVGSSKFKALNDFVIERRTHRAIILNVQAGNENLDTYLTDGLIVATPTGSTAYSFAAGGPVINPLLCVLILTPVSAHTLMNRSFVLAGNESVKIISEDDCFLTIDGQEKIPVKNHTSIVIKKSPYVFKLVRVGERKFYSKVYKCLKV